MEKERMATGHWVLKTWDGHGPITFFEWAHHVDLTTTKALWAEAFVSQPTLWSTRYKPLNCHFPCRFCTTYQRTNRLCFPLVHGAFINCPLDHGTPMLLSLTTPTKKIKKERKVLKWNIKIYTQMFLFKSYAYFNTLFFFIKMIGIFYGKNLA